MMDELKSSNFSALHTSHARVRVLDMGYVNRPDGILKLIG